LILIVEGFTDFAEFFNLVSVLLPFFFECETLFSEFSDLNFVVLVVEELSFVFFDADSEHLDFVGESLYFNGLEDDDELDVLSEVCLFVIGEVLDSGSM
jgi:hypothetical protein